MVKTDFKKNIRRLHLKKRWAVPSASVRPIEERTRVWKKRTQNAPSDTVVKKTVLGIFKVESS